MKLPLALLLATPCLAGDLWVDPIAGNDGNSGSGPGDALRTVTRAIDLHGSVGANVDRVLMMPGVYSPAANGETLPLAMRDRLHLVGTGAAEAAVVTGGTTLVEVDANAVGETSIDTKLKRLKLQAGARGVGVTSAGPGAPSASLTLENVVIEGCGIGIDVGISNFALALDSNTVRLDRVVVRDCIFVGVRVVAEQFNNVSLGAADSEITGTAGAGLAVFAQGKAYATLSLQRTRFTGNGGDGVSTSEQGSGAIFGEISDCLVADNFFDGLDLTGSLLVQRCTIADNGSRGLRATLGLGCPNLRDSIVAGNGDDLLGACLVVESSIIGDGDHAGVDGNLGGDPGFVGPGDYRLQFGSPAVDSAVGGEDAPDLRGHPRSVDGDNDLDPRPDRGALELRTLDGPSVVAPGAVVELAVHGRAAGFALVRVSLTGLATAPQSSPFGASWLPADATSLTVVRTTRGAPTPFVWTAPPFGGLLGQTVGFQALVRTFAATSGGAWSNPLELEVEP